MANTILRRKDIRGIDLSFNPNPNTGDISVLSHTAAVRASLQNLLQYGLLDKPFQEQIQSSLSDVLFETNGTVNVSAVESRIVNTIERLEPRVGVQSVDVYMNSKSQLEVVIQYILKETREADNLSTTLELSE